MSAKSSVMLGMTIGSIFGSYLPALWGGSLFSYTSILTGTIGGFIGVIIAYKLSSNL